MGVMIERLDGNTFEDSTNGINFDLFLFLSASWSARHSFTRRWIDSSITHGVQGEQARVAAQPRIMSTT